MSAFWHFRAAEERVQPANKCGPFSHTLLWAPVITKEKHSVWSSGAVLPQKTPQHLNSHKSNRRRIYPKASSFRWDGGLALSEQQQFLLATLQDFSKCRPNVKDGWETLIATEDIPLCWEIHHEWRWEAKASEKHKKHERQPLTWIKWIQKMPGPDFWADYKIFS